MNNFTALGSSPAATLARARDTAHAAAQLLCRAAIANVAAQPDTSHTSLAWADAHGALVTQLMSTVLGPIHVALSFAPLQISILHAGKRSARLDLNGRRTDEAIAWLDERLELCGLNPVSGIELPYALPDAVAQLNRYVVGEDAQAYAELVAWYGLANEKLGALAQAKTEHTQAPTPVRCWPHHFDIAIYVQLEDGDLESARGIGAGMSPGDGTYNQPYFYINPFPAPDAEQLPEAPSPGHWHLQGFVGACATREELLAGPAGAGGLGSFLDQSFEIGLQAR